MKFPLKQKAFPEVKLTAEQCAEYQHLAQCLLDEALDEYEHFNTRQQRQLGASQWKPIKSRDNVTVYRERCTRPHVSHPDGSSASKPSTSASSSSPYDLAASDPSHGNLAQHVARNESLASSSESSSSSSMAAIGATGVAEASERLLPKLLGVGTVDGMIEDMVYGMASPQAGHAMLKAAYTKDEIVDTDVLYEMQGPTPEHPLRFVGMKWLVKGHTNGIGTLVRPRDFVYLETSGIHTRADGARIGYHVWHSVDLPECRELADLSIVRGRFSLCFLFRELANCTVDVYMKSLVDLSGNLGDTVAITTSTKSLISFQKAIICSQNKKIAWALFKKRRNIQCNGAPSVGSSRSGNSSSICGVCSKAYSTFGTTWSCTLCEVSMCSRCRDERKLTTLVGAPKRRTTSSGRAGKQVVQEAVTLCQPCVARCNLTNAADVAREEILNGQYGSVPAATADSPPPLSPPPASTSAVSDSSLSNSEATVMQPTTGPENSIDIGKILLTEPSSDFDSAAIRSSPKKTLTIDQTDIGNESNDGVIEVEREDSEWATHFRRHNEALPSQPPAPKTYHNERELYQRIAELNQAAESVYQYTKRTTATLLHSSSSAVVGPSMLTPTATIDEEELD